MLLLRLLLRWQTLCISSTRPLLLLPQLLLKQALGTGTIVLTKWTTRMLLQQRRLWLLPQLLLWLLLLLLPLLLRLQLSRQLLVKAGSLPRGNALTVLNSPWSICS